MFIALYDHSNPKIYRILDHGLPRVVVGVQKAVLYSCSPERSPERSPHPHLWCSKVVLQGSTHIAPVLSHFALPTEHTLELQAEQVRQSASGLTSDFASSAAAAAAVRPPGSGFPLPDFNDAEEAFHAKSTGQLMQSLAVFSACTSKPFVQNADKLLEVSKRILGVTLVKVAVKNTFFKHFCAGVFSPPSVTSN
jgi:hypothetical protein